MCWQSVCVCACNVRRCSVHSRGAKRPQGSSSHVTVSVNGMITAALPIWLKINGQDFGWWTSVQFRGSSSKSTSLRPCTLGAVVWRRFVVQRSCGGGRTGALRQEAGCVLVLSRRTAWCSKRLGRVSWSAHLVPDAGSDEVVTRVWLSNSGRQRKLSCAARAGSMITKTCCEFPMWSGRSSEDQVDGQRGTVPWGGLRWSSSQQRNWAVTAPEQRQLNRALSCHASSPSFCSVNLCEKSVSCTSEWLARVFLWHLWGDKSTASHRAHS